MNNSNRRAAFTRILLATVLCASSVPVQAFELKELPYGLKGSFDTTLSLGGMTRVQKRDPGLVGIANGGTARSVNEDDGNLNYGRGSIVSAAAKATHDLDLKYNDFGIFMRGSYFYDAAARTKGPLGETARDRAGHDAQILDAYARARFDIAGRALGVRFGKQVLSWGESTFIQNGVNIINPVDVTKLRVPGSELKEALIPTPLLSVSQEVTKNLSVEGFYATSFYKTRIDQRGTFFSNNDFLSEDGNRVYFGSGFFPDQHATAGTQVFAPRSDDRLAKDSGQFGVALRHLFPDFGNTEIGLYHITYHSRIPYVSGIKGSASLLSTLGTARYFAEYPEDIRLYAMSFNTQGPFGVALQGEYAYRPNQPVQIAAPEVLLAALNGTTIGHPANMQNQITGTNPISNDTYIQGYRRLQMSQAQMTATKAFGPTLRAEQWVVVGEVGMNYFHNMPIGLSFNGPGVYLPAMGSYTGASSGATQPSGYMTDTSWGYRLITRMDFSNLIGAATVSPRLSFSHDVRGVGPNFNQQAKAVALGLNYNLRQTWVVDLGYTTFFGGRTYDGVNPTGGLGYSSGANPLKDRDFVATSVSYAF